MSCVLVQLSFVFPPLDAIAVRGLPRLPRTPGVYVAGPRLQGVPFEFHLALCSSPYPDWFISNFRFFGGSFRVWCVFDLFFFQSSINFPTKISTRTSPTRTYPLVVSCYITSLVGPLQTRQNRPQQSLAVWTFALWTLSG